MGKRGRKPSADKQRSGYFYEREEQAVLDYLHSNSIAEREEIFNTILRPAFDKMIESIIRRYKLFIPNESTADTFNDVYSHLLLKASKFDTGKYKKAYSYYGTICKNYLLGRIDKYNTALERNPSYDAMSEKLINNINYIEETDRGTEVAMDIFDGLISRLRQMTEEPECLSLKKDELKLGKALLNLFEHWDYVLSTDTSNKFNKSAILMFLKEQTGMDAKGIRDNMKKFKKEFLIIKNDILNY